MSYFLALLGIVGAFFMLKYREAIGNMFGEAEWMHYIGGIYNVIIVVAIFIFLWSISALTGTTDMLFAPVKWILPGFNTAPTETGF